MNDQVPGIGPCGWAHLRLTAAWIPAYHVQRIPFDSVQPYEASLPLALNWSWMVVETGSIFCYCLSHIPFSVSWMGFFPGVCGWVCLIRICCPTITLHCIKWPKIGAALNTTWGVLMMVLMRAFSGTYWMCRTMGSAAVLSLPILEHTPWNALTWPFHNPESKLKNLKVQIDSVWHNLMTVIDIIWWCWLTEEILRN